jgi:hypothetical protein
MKTRRLFSNRRGKFQIYKKIKKWKKNKNFQKILKI